MTDRMNEYERLVRSYDEREYDREWCKDKEMRDYCSSVYHYLQRMKRGKVLRFGRYKDRQLRWVVLTCCFFLTHGDHWAYYTFSPDFSSIRKTD